MLSVRDISVPIKAIIADDHPLFSAALRQILGASLQGDVRDAENFTQLMEILQREPDVELVLMDLNMPGNQGADRADRRPQSVSGRAGHYCLCQ